MNKIVWPTIDSKHLIVDSKQMLKLEKEMFSDGMPQEALMEKAGIQISRWLLKKKPLLKHGITVFIGPGHNGGDGAVIARELFLNGFYVQVWCPFTIKKTSTNNHLNYLTSIGVTKLVERPDPNGKELWIDAVFGNNQKRKVDNTLIKLFNQKFHNKYGKVISIDIPTGLCPDKGEPFFDNAVKADYTLVIGLNKIGLTQDSALPFIGELHHIDIGVPINKLSKIEKKIINVTYKDLKNIDLPSLPKNSNKYKRGRTLIIAGSEKYPGAAYLSLRGAISSGAGFISAVLPELVAESIWQVAPEIVLKGTMTTNQNGNASLFSALKNIDLNLYDSLAVGPGIGIDNDDWQKSKDYLIGFKGLLILDADALNRISESKLGSKFFIERKFQTWITPHIKEFSRLFPNIEGETNVGLALKAAKEFNISVLLKGANSIVADDEKAWQLFGTDSQTARAGLGDLLSGFIAGSSAIDLTLCKKITTDFFTKYVLLHSFAASKCKTGSNAYAIGDELSKLMRNRKTRQIS
ncbi:bifunctional ADP-dependent NAD(P)H-hydrate dehydratase/NAD(P)H-hydrate epimerase [Prochlorococcus marinus str. MU1402]|uniref:NAD(P)H-hydrate dehydratase n=1 Tax=Prochlorococcus marinus TaxID=1219 RepID=UPI001ADB1928|nr:NAD(P)H-hydrate dehydratase [Prochlorococcus marinus]MBO8232456.1 NAD(P)H-hydrate dehydratase [Prochlorococcus marinus XMU1402]MBW3057183.1 bifunctional ADP-dependent NAD(P)H-hydrate dehydratase/NAD(P)H-hydrate epimerase [Prochlorococcus marinus str. MU1402]